MDTPIDSQIVKQTEPNQAQISMELEPDEEVKQPPSHPPHSMMLNHGQDVNLQKSPREEEKAAFKHEKTQILQHRHPEYAASPVVFVRSLPPEANENNIERVCSKFGKVKQVCLLLMGSSAKPQAFVEFEVVARFNIYSPYVG